MWLGAWPYLPGNDINKIILEIFGHARAQTHANRRSEQQSYPSNELRARILAIASRVGVDDVPENERIQQRKNLIDRRQDKSDDSELPQILKVPVESSHVSEAAVPRTTLDDLSREPLLNRRFQAQDTAAACARYLFTDCEDLIIDPNTPVPYPYANAYLKFHSLQRSQLHSSTISRWVL